MSDEYDIQIPVKVQKGLRLQIPRKIAKMYGIKPYDDVVICAKKQKAE